MKWGGGGGRTTFDISHPLVSIIIPVYNREQFISECLDSALNQTYQNIEIICIDDGSTDNSLKILHEYQNKYPNIIKVIKKKNGGVSSACNEGIKNMSGDYVKWLGSDDALYSNCIEEFVNYVRELSDPKYIIMSSFDYMDENSVVYDVFKLPCLDDLDDKNITTRVLFGYYPIGTGIMFMHKSAFNYCMFDELFLYGEDYDLILKLLVWHKFKLRIIPKSLSKGRKHAMSLQSEILYGDGMKIILNIRKNILNSLDKSERLSYNKELKKVLKTMPLRSRFRFIYQNIMNNILGYNNTYKILRFYRKITKR